MQQHGSKCYACRRPPPTLGMGSIGQNSTFLEHGHVAYQIKGNHECTNMVANILPAEAPPTPVTLGMGSIGKKSTFLEHGHVAYGSFVKIKPSRKFPNLQYLKLNKSEKHLPIALKRKWTGPIDRCGKFHSV